MQDRATQQTDTDSGVPHEGKYVFDVTTWKWYHVRDSYTIGAGRDVWLHPPGGYDSRHLDTDDFVAEIGHRLLLKRVAKAIGEQGSFTDEVGTMAYSVFTDTLDLPDQVLTCPDCGATAEDGQIRMRHTMAGHEDGEGPRIHCRNCVTEFACVRPGAFDP